MIKDNPFKLIWGVWAVVIYVVMVALLLIYFNVRSSDRSKHFVKKDEHRIQVALSTPKESTTMQHVRENTKDKPKSKPPKSKTKTAKRPTEHTKKPVKPAKQAIEKKKIPKKAVKSVKKEIAKPNKHNNNKIKKQKVSNLFSEIKTKKIISKEAKPVKKPTRTHPTSQKKRPSVSEKINNALKIQKSSDSGIENAYLAKVEERLNGWPAQSDYAGEKAKVWLKIEPSGYFEFKVISFSNNPDFNEGLIAYLKQLQRFGFGRHKGRRPYEIDVEFVAKE